MACNLNQNHDSDYVLKGAKNLDNVFLVMLIGVILVLIVMLSCYIG